jgi:hypothetical protein
VSGEDIPTESRTTRGNPLQLHTVAWTNLPHDPLWAPCPRCHETWLIHITPRVMRTLNQFLNPQLSPNARINRANKVLN